MTAWVIMLAFSWLSMRLRKRYPIVLVGSLSNMIGLAIELAHPPQAGVRYLGLFFLTTGSYIVMPITVVWLSNNVDKGYKRAAALGLLAPIGNCGAILSSNVFITAESPVFRTGFATGLGMNCLSLVAMTVLFVFLLTKNRQFESKAEVEDKSEARRYLL